MLRRRQKNDAARMAHQDRGARMLVMGIELLDCHGQGVDALTPRFTVSRLLFDGSRRDGLKNWKECVDRDVACNDSMP